MSTTYIGKSNLSHLICRAIAKNRRIAIWLELGSKMLLLCLFCCKMLRTVVSVIINNTLPSLSEPHSSPPVDLDSSSDTSFDLSKSFEQAIQTQRIKSAMQKPSSSTSIPDMSDSDSQDASSMCRMLNNLELVTGHTFAQEKSSPCKMVGLTRPSTVVEETSMSTSRSFCTAMAATQAGSSASGRNSTGSFDYTRDSLQHQESLGSANQHFEEDSLNQDHVEASTSRRDTHHIESAVRPEESSANRFNPDDTLEDVEYDRNGSKYILRPTQKLRRYASSSVEIDSSPENVIQLDDDDSDEPEDTSYETARTHVKTEASEYSFAKIQTNANQSNIDADEHLSVSMNTANRSESRIADESHVISLIDSDDSESESDRKEPIAHHHTDIGKPL